MDVGIIFIISIINSLSCTGGQTGTGCMQCVCRREGGRRWVG